MMHIRTAAAADAESLAELNHAFNGVYRGSDHVRSVLQTARSTETVLVAEDSGGVVGFV
jgi:predicted N-acetyltransferase YhbS